MSVHWQGVSKWQIEHFLLLPEPQYHRVKLFAFSTLIPPIHFQSLFFLWQHFSQWWQVYKWTVYSYSAIQQHVYCLKSSNIAASSSFPWCIHYESHTTGYQIKFSLMNILKDKVCLCRIASLPESLPWSYFQMKHSFLINIILQMRNACL